ncbi:L-aspartate oxidase [Reinekea marinisedimentorum]|uniref:L-aspartate oxidase n=1 Tax=Reinekea marinisedimentorum TaxID=230495 RepID=A0A4V2UJH1_9GAMM|nr:L-aspartate oxidase [Reinekea marinisedimentorum]TCS39800.1 L-aspartate oxidase [Reinekea marinisedimentorum]
MSVRLSTDVLIIGTGAAGLTAALSLPNTTNVLILCKGEIGGGSTSWAQGGIAGVLDEVDSVDQHVQDTLTAGAGLCDPAAVRYTIERSTDALHWLINQGVPFTHVDGSDVKLHLTREGGHSQRRIIHAADATGLAISDTLIKKVRQAPNIQLLENHIAIDLITTEKLGDTTQENRCVGAYTLNSKTEETVTIGSRFTMLATGGASKAYLFTSNPDGATGDGVAMAWRAGCQVVNMEFNQFHPTCLFHPKAKSFLISEAVRGEGGLLKLPNGERFMPKFDERAELAPRDIVARAIDHEMKRLGADNLYLDISHKSPEFIKSHFPTIYKRCLEYGYDMTKEPIPIVPAAHYTCGGLRIDNNGATDVKGLYAAGECTYTGLHGANRLASNSLLECIVYAQAVAKHISQSSEEQFDPNTLPLWDESRVSDSDEKVVITHNWDELRRFMWDYVGIVRTDKRLERAKRRIQLLKQEITEYYSNFKITADLLELRNLVVVAELMIESAMARKESRGLHYTRSHPETSDRVEITVLSPKKTEA